MELEEVVRSLCLDLPDAIGAIVCDHEGESVVHAYGASPPPIEAEAEARARMPRDFQSQLGAREFLLRLAGAEPCAVLRLIEQGGLRQGAGALSSLELRFAAVEMLIRRLPEEFYVMLALKRPTLKARARMRLDSAARDLARLIA